MSVFIDDGNDVTSIAVPPSPEKHAEYFMKEMVRRKDDIKKFLQFNISYASCNIYDLEDSFHVMLSHNIVAGGALVELIHPNTDIYSHTGLKIEPINDIDIFILDTEKGKESAERFLGVLAAWKNSIHHKIMGVQKREFSNSYGNLSKITKIIDIPLRNVLADQHFLAKSFQLIFTNHKTGKDLVETFDLRHTKVRMEQRKTVVLSEQTFQDIKNKRLVRTNIGKELSPTRLDKFLKRGWKEVAAYNMEYLQPMATGWQVQSSDHYKPPGVTSGWQQVGQNIPTPLQQVVTVTNDGSGYFQKAPSPPLTASQQAAIDAAKASIEVQAAALNKISKMVEQKSLAKETLIDILAKSGYLNKNVT